MQIHNPQNGGFWWVMLGNFSENSIYLAAAPAGILEILTCRFAGPGVGVCREGRCCFFLGRDKFPHRFSFPNLP